MRSGPAFFCGICPDFAPKSCRCATIGVMQETFPERLRRLLDEKHYGKPISKIASEVGVDQATIKSALDGETTPRFPTMEKLAAYLGVSYEYLETGEGSPEPPPADLPDIRARVDAALEALESIKQDLDRQQGNGKP